jgi:hypothetical protein
MTDEVPFSEAERVFNKVLDLVEAHVEATSPGASGVSYTFGFMAGLVEHRHIVATYTGADGGSGRVAVLLPASAGFQRSQHYDLLLDLTSQEAELLTELVWLGACTGFWYVENLADIKGRVQQRRYDYFSGYPQMPVADPMALLAAFASGELEALWPQRKVLIEKGWFIWQARIRETAATWDAQIAEQGGGRAQELWAEGASADVPDYLT